MNIIGDREDKFIVTVYRLGDRSLYERRVFALREELDKYLKSIVLENCEVSIFPYENLSSVISQNISNLECKKWD